MIRSRVIRGVVAASLMLGLGRAALLFAQEPDAKSATKAVPKGGRPTAAPKAPPASPPERNAPEGGQLRTSRNFGSVRVEGLDGTSSLILDGPREQVEAMKRIIEALDQFSAGDEADIRIVHLENADPESSAKMLTRVYDSRNAAGGGAAPTTTTSTSLKKVTFIPLAVPSALVVVARRIEMDEVIKFIAQVDGGAKEAPVQFRIFKLKLAPASIVQTKIQQFFAQRTGAGAAAGAAAPGATTTEEAAHLRVRVEALADERTNSLIVYASPADLIQVEKLIMQLDTDSNSAVSELRIFNLRNAVATELATLFQTALVSRSASTLSSAAGRGVGLGQPTAGGPGAQFGGGQPGGQFGAQGGGQGLGQGGGLGAPGSALGSGMAVSKSAKLRFLTKGPNGNAIESGILEDIAVIADERTNSLIVTAPATSMSLVEELIHQLDSVPGPSAALKVFTLQNSDVFAMLQVLQSVFLGQQQQTGGQGGPGGGVGINQQRAQQQTFLLGGQEAQVSLVPLAFSADQRTNSIIVAGGSNDLLAVEALILKLDANTARERKFTVYKLRNLTADDASAAIQDFLAAQSTTGAGGGAAAGQQLTLQEQIRNEVSVTPEPTSNNLLISSTPRFYDEIMQLITQIDMRPPQVVVQVLMAEVQLLDNEDLGAELGVQNGVLFDRGLAVRPLTTDQENSRSPGFGFNTTNALPTPFRSGGEPAGLQSLSNFALGRAGSAGFGGLILSASSENLSVLIRALKRQQRLDILSRPQIQTLDNQQAQIQIGQRFPRITGTQVNTLGNSINTIEYEPIGIILNVTPKISPDGIVQMRVEPQVSSLDQNSSVTIGTSGNGTPITAPIINTTVATTTITAANGQTVVIGGLMKKDKIVDERKVPFIGDIPIVGWAFKTRFKTGTKRELLIILTPHIVYCEEDAQRIKDIEARRMDWILSDVIAVHGDLGLTEDAPFMEDVDFGATVNEPTPVAPSQEPAPPPADDAQLKPANPESGKPVPKDDTIKPDMSAKAGRKANGALSRTSNKPIVIETSYPKAKEKPGLLTRLKRIGKE